MTVYLLDENVLRELHPSGNANVRAWYAGVDSGDLRISAMTFFEKRRGWERRKKSDPDLAAAKLAELDALEAATDHAWCRPTLQSWRSGHGCSERRTRTSVTGRLRQPPACMVSCW